MSDSEPVTSPDQHRPINRRAWRIAAAISVVALLLMLSPLNTWTENIWLIGTAAIIAAIPVIDAVLRRNGLR